MADRGPDPHSAARSSPRAELDDVSVLQREVNERLVLTALRAHEETESAVEQRRHAEARAQELRDTAALRERLIGIIGHDLRSPLNAIVMAAGSQLYRGELAEADARLATQVVTSGRRMARMLDQLVQFTRARLGGGFTLDFSACDLGKVCHDVAEELRIGSSREIEQTTSGGDLHGTWDADRAAEALSNVVGNAVEHAAADTPIGIDVRGESEAVLVTVTNRGKIIPAELLPVLFTAFRGAREGSQANRDHLGLGLYIASEIVRAHGGTLDVVSAGDTTTFTMRLPRVPPSVHSSV